MCYFLSGMINSIDIVNSDEHKTDRIEGVTPSTLIEINPVFIIVADKEVSKLKDIGIKEELKFYMEELSRKIKFIK